MWLLSESVIRFSNFQNFKKKNFQKTNLTLKFKLHIQDSFLKDFFLEIWRYEKQVALSEKKPPLSRGRNATPAIFLSIYSFDIKNRELLYRIQIPIKIK